MIPFFLDCANKTGENESGAVPFHFLLLLGNELFLC